MKKKYEVPVIEKIVFDYKVQTKVSPPSDCFGSVINVSVGTEVCGSGTPAYIGWNDPSPAPF